MQFPSQKRIWLMMPGKDQALLEAIFRYGMSRRAVGRLTGMSRNMVTHRVVCLLRLLRNEKVVAAMQRAEGNDLYLLKLFYLHRMSAVQIAAHSGLSGDHRGHEADAIRRRIRRILLEKGEPDAASQEVA